jgi:hypothetical protein
LSSASDPAPLVPLLAATLAALCELVAAPPVVAPPPFADVPAIAVADVPATAVAVVPASAVAVEAACTIVVAGVVFTVVFPATVMVLPAMLMVVACETVDVLKTFEVEVEIVLVTVVEVFT